MNLKFVIGITCIVSSILAQDGKRCKTPDDEEETCVDPLNCRPFIQFVQLNLELTQFQKSRLLEYQCKIRGPPRVCCPSSTIEIPPAETTESHHNLKLLPTKQCGVTNMTIGKVFGGQEAALYQFPWLAQLSYKRGSGIDFLCGGSVISERYILTAAHCLTDALIGVRVGEYNTSSQMDCKLDEDNKQHCAPPVQNVYIEKQIKHESFDTPKLANDIGLIRLTTPLTFNNGVQPICLPYFSDLIAFNLTNRLLTVTGFGLTESGYKSKVPMFAKVPVVADEECRSNYSSRQVEVSDSQLCAGNKRSDSCQGDSGGPLQSLSLISLPGPARIYQYGIVSGGTVVCSTELTGLYTRVGSHIKWILDNLEP